MSKYHSSNQHDELIAMLATLPESPGVMRLQCQILRHPSFFPGGRGYVGPDFPERPVMILGHNFDTDEGFRRSMQRGHEDFEMPTWRNLLKYVLPESRTPVEDCFFTNLYLGAMIHPEPKPGEALKGNTGTFKCSKGYESACMHALNAQIRIVRPSVIALLGAVVPAKFQKVFPAFKDTVNQPVGGQTLYLLPDLTTQVVKLVHPSNPRSNDSHREQGRVLSKALAAYKAAQ